MNLQKYRAAGNIVGFYDIPMFCSDGERAIYDDLIIWGEKQEAWRDSEKQKPFDFWYGRLDEAKFDTDEKKVAYIQGVFESYAGENLNNTNCLTFANSIDTVERVKKWGNQVYLNRFKFRTVKVGEYKVPLWNVWKSQKTLNYIPNVNILELHPEFIEFIKTYEFTL